MSGQPWQTGWYGQAKHRPMQLHSARTWETAVGGTKNSLRAIYGSTDNAKEDHRNDTLCRVVETVNATSEPRRIDTKYTSTWDEVTTYQPITEKEITLWAKRAAARNMSITDYARDVMHRIP